MKRFNLLVRKYLLIWALCAMVIGYLAGRYNNERVLSLQFLVTPLLFLMVFIMVFSSSLSSFAKLKLYLYPMGGSFILFLICPFLSYLIIQIIPDSFQYLGTGILISSTVPPDAMLSAWTGFLEGDILLTLIIQSFTFIIWIFLVPFGFSLFFGSSAHFSLLLLIRNLFFMIVIPYLLAGILKMILKRVVFITEDLMERLKPTLSTASGIIELFIILISVALGAEIITANPVIIGWGVLTAAFYYSAAFIVSIYFTRLLRLSYEKAIPLIYENGSRNLSIAMVVAITSFKDQAILGVAASILAQFPISALFYAILRRHSISHID
ncbi:MAG: arsenic resistance protein [Spirochaetota bacterium]|nr:MAG: arsenic resistance protein [Spirochaetota bacterium]